MINIQDLGNRELGDCFYSIRARVNHTFGIDGLSDSDFKNDSRYCYDRNYIPSNFFSSLERLYFNLLVQAKKSHFAMLRDIDNLSDGEKRDLALLFLLEHEITNRGFDPESEYIVWELRCHPTYIREILATNYHGEASISDELGQIMLDSPVREACKVLNQKGYTTYWSSANISDALRRKGHVIKEKNVAYILIDPSNLTDDLKQLLFLNGDNEFWGVALLHSDNGKYYGIWAEITDENMPCKDLSYVLVQRALALPELQTDIIDTKKIELI